MKFHISAIVLFSLTLVGCTASQQEYEAVQAALEGSPKFRNTVAVECAKQAGSWSKSDAENLAALMNVSESSARAVYCRRVINGIANGRITYADYKSGVTPKMIRIIQGR